MSTNSAEQPVLGIFHPPSDLSNKVVTWRLSKEIAGSHLCQRGLLFTCSHGMGQAWFVKGLSCGDGRVWEWIKPLGVNCEILRRAYLMEGAVVGVETLAGSTLLWKYYIVNICLGEWSVMLFTESCHMYHVSNAKFQNNRIQSDAEQILICL